MHTWFNKPFLDAQLQIQSKDADLKANGVYVYQANVTRSAVNYALQIKFA